MASAATIHDAARVHAELARERKAVVWVDLFERFSINAEQVERLTDAEWQRIAAASGLRVPRTSKPLIIARLRSRVPVNPATGRPMLLAPPKFCAVCDGVVDTPGCESEYLCTCSPEVRR